MPGPTQGKASVLTFPVKLTLGPEKMLAVVVTDSTAVLPSEASDPTPSDANRAAETGFAVLEQVGFD